MTTNLPLVSIITPSFNQGKFIEKTILSVVNQSYPAIEFIVIDGGSTDETLSIIKKYSQQINYWISEKDAGQSHAINKGLDHAKGNIVAYLNTDDLLEKNAVEETVNAFMQNEKLALVYGKCTTIDEHGDEILAAKGGDINYNKQLKVGMLPWIFQPACFFNIENIKRKPLFRINLQYTMDYELVLYILKRKLPVKFIDKPFAKYRVHSNAKTVNQSHKLYMEKLKVQFSYAPFSIFSLAYKYAKHQLKMVIYPTGS